MGFEETDWKSSDFHEDTEDCDRKLCKLMNKCNMGVDDEIFFEDVSQGEEIVRYREMFCIGDCAVATVALSETCLKYDQYKMRKIGVQLSALCDANFKPDTFDPEVCDKHFTKAAVMASSFFADKCQDKTDAHICDKESNCGEYLHFITDLEATEC